MIVSADPAASLFCSDADELIGDDLAGTCATFKTFLLIEHRGSWSESAAADAVAAALPVEADKVLALPELRPFAIRPIGRVEPQESTLTHVGRVGHDSLLERVTFSTLDSLSHLQEQPGSGSAPIFAVCTNGARDRCCALKGRPLAQHLHQQLLDGGESPVVEISHLGGHRFASTMMVLPWGYSYGRLTEALALEIAHAAQQGLVHPSGLRGRADLSPASQAAEIMWRNKIGPAPIDAVTGIEEAAEAGTTVVSATVLGHPTSLLMSYETGSLVDRTRCGGKPFATGRWSGE